MQVRGAEASAGLYSRRVNDRITDEHGSIEQSLRELERTLNRGSKRPSRDLPAQLARLATTLLEHFATEGDSDLYADVVARRPDLAADLAELRVEHSSILEMLDDVRVAARRADAADLRTRELLKGLISSVRLHERAEAELLKDALSHRSTVH